MVVRQSNQSLIVVSAQVIRIMECDILARHVHTGSSEDMAYFAKGDAIALAIRFE